MVRTQISFEAESHRRARERAADLGISLSEYVRRLVARDLGEGSTQPHPSDLFDLGDSGGSNIARYKDEYIGEAVEAAVLGKRRSSKG